MREERKEYEFDLEQENKIEQPIGNPIDEGKSRARQARRRKKRSKSLWKRTGALVLSTALFGAVAGGSFYGVSQWLGTGTESVSQSVNTAAEGEVLRLSTNTDGETRYGMDVSDIATEALPSVVSITNISVQEVKNYFNRFGPDSFGQTQLEESTSCGSGVIFYQDDNYLYILTNQHVVEDASTLSVAFVDDSVYDAQLCGVDETVDLAVLKISCSDLSEETLAAISVISIGDSNELEVGEQVVAIGNALGYGQSVTTGIVSALNRSLSNDDGTQNTYIQTDAAINPGNSGGALLNLDGELVGINTAKLASTDVEGMGYAIPISDVLELVSELMTQSTELSQTVSVGQPQSQRMPR